MQEILFPVLTGLSLVFAGILVGYFLWFRDRHEQIALCQQLTADRERLTRECHEMNQQLADRETQLERRAAKCSSLQQLCDDLMASRESVMRHSSEMENELYSARCKLDQAREQIAAAHLLRAKSEENLHAAKRSLQESLSDTESQWREKLAQSQSRAAQFEADFHRLTGTQQHTASLLHQANATVAELKSELGAQRQMLETSKTNAAGLEKEYVSLETSLRSSQVEINEARGQAAAADSARELADEELAQFRQRTANQQKQIQRLEEQLSSLNAVQERCAILEQAMKSEGINNQSLVAERSESIQRCADLEVSLAAVNKRSENQESTIRALRFHLDAATKRLGQTLEQLQSDSESRSPSLELRTRLDSLLRQRDNAFDQIRSLTGELSQLKKHMRSNEETIRNLRRERGAVLLRNRQPTETFPRIHFAPATEPAPSEQLAQEYGGVTRIDSVRGIVFVETPRIQDDLKLIHGVGEVLEQRLNDFGIYSFKQIMLWNDRAIDKFSELLIFKDRIRRDDWPGQAKRLLNQGTRGAA